MKCFDKEVTTRATAKSLLEHSWLPATTREEPLDISDMRKSISIYNRRPTVSQEESPNLSYLNFIVEGTYSCHSCLSLKTHRNFRER
jgi:hypothetical protein